jgi:predicted nucleotidyltransferase
MQADPSCHEIATEIHTRLLSLKKTGHVRLDEEEINALAYALKGVSTESINLFGSRVEPERRGGDIDLLVLTRAPAFETAQDIAIRFFSRCEEKIDVVVMNPNQLTPEQADFLSRINRIEIAP